MVMQFFNNSFLNSVRTAPVIAPVGRFLKRPAGLRPTGLRMEDNSPDGTVLAFLSRPTRRIDQLQSVFTSEQYSPAKSAYISVT